MRDADALVIEATFLDRDSALARSRGHLTAAAAAGLAREAGVGELLLTHISGRYRPEEIGAEAAGIFPMSGSSPTSTRLPSRAIHLLHGQCLKHIPTALDRRAAISRTLRRFSQRSLRSR